MSPTLSFGSAKQLAAILIAIAVVIGAGIVVGQAPAIFDAEIEDDPEASIEFDDHHGDGTSVEVANVTTSDGGFIVISDGTGEVLGISESLDAGSHESVTVEQDEESDLEMLGQLTATVHQDTTEDGEFRYEETDGEEDRPYLEDGYPVSDTATVTMAERTNEAPMDTFVVESVDGPDEAATTETVEFVGEIHNPADFELRQYTEFRLNGELIERQVLTLEADETRELTFEVDLSEVEPGTQIYGIYTAEDGAQAEIDVAFDGPPTLTVTEAEPSAVTVDVEMPEDGFVAIEDTDGTVVTTSEALDAGIHEAVSIDLDDVDETETLTAVAYAGDPDELDDATPYEHEGERVAVPIEFDDEDGDPEAEPDDGDEAGTDDTDDGDEAGTDGTDDGDEAETDDA